MFHPPLLETRSLQGSMVNFLRVWRREPLRSAYSLLGFIIDLFVRVPGHRLVAGPIRGPHCLLDPFCVVSPAPFLGRVADLGPDALRLFSTAFFKADTGADIPGAAGVGQKTWPTSNSAGDLQTLVLVTLVASPLHIKRYSRRNPVVQRAVLRRNRSPFVATAGRRK